MRKATYSGIIVTILLITTVLALGQQEAAKGPKDPMGEQDVCTVVLKETAKPNHWIVEVNLTNDEPLFGMTFPFLITSSKGSLTYDSTSFAGTRVENFAVKIPHEDVDFTKTGKANSPGYQIPVPWFAMILLDHRSYSPCFAASISLSIFNCCTAFSNREMRCFNSRVSDWADRSAAVFFSSSVRHVSTSGSPQEKTATAADRTRPTA